MFSVSSDGYLDWLLFLFPTVIPPPDHATLNLEFWKPYPSVLRVFCGNPWGKFVWELLKGFYYYYKYMYVLLDFTVNFPEEIELQSILAYFNVLRTILFVFSSPYKWEDLTESPFAKDFFTTVVNTPHRICCILLNLFVAWTRYRKSFYNFVIFDMIYSSFSFIICLYFHTD